jgi:hypothetical protein
VSGRLSAQNQNSAEVTISMAGARSTPAGLLLKPRAVDRRLAYKNLRTGLIAGAIAIIVFALSWVVGLVY